MLALAEVVVDLALPEVLARLGVVALPGAPGAPTVLAVLAPLAGRGGAGGRGGFAGGLTPVILSRNGRKFTVSGDTTVLAGTEIRAESEAPSLNISVRELDNGSWVIVELPGYTSAATGTAQTSLDALRSASDTSYYKGDGSLWVKLVSNGGGARPRSWRRNSKQYPSQQTKVGFRLRDHQSS